LQLWVANWPGSSFLIILMENFKHEKYKIVVQ
jgi:hypothetical protein